MNWLRLGLVLWGLLGFVGYVMYLSNPNTRPQKVFLYPIALFTHCFFGLIGLFYGYICFSSRKNELKSNVSGKT